VAHPKRNVFAMIGWVVWKILALVGLPAAKKKVASRSSARRR